MVTIACNGVVFPNIKAILFDKDGTLEDSRLFLQQLARERVQQIAVTIPSITENLLLSLGITEKGLDPKGLMAVGSRQENELAAAAYIAISGCGWFAAKDIARQAFDRAAVKIKPSKRSSPLFSGSLEVIQSLVNANIKLGIISADSRQGVKHFLDREQINSYFQVALGSDPSLSKPSPLLYLKGCEILGIEPQNTLMVGDSLSDILMAEQANARGIIGIHWGSPNAQHLNRASVTIDRLGAIQIL